MTTCENKIVLVIRGLAIPSFKNKKRAIQDRNTGKLRTMTDARTQRLMEEITLAIVSQLSLSIPMPEGGTLTAQHLRSWIASSLPLDDSRQWVPELFVKAVDVDKGCEGAEIIIEPL